MLSRILDRGIDAFLFALKKYFRIQVEGIEWVPPQGRCLVVSNHSGFAGADAILLSHLLRCHRGQPPVILAHRAFFKWVPALRPFFERFNLREACMDSGVSALQEERCVLLFPEGEDGNFKPSSERYHLQPFHTGFLRMARETGALMIPCLVLGAEEAHFNLGKIELSSFGKTIKLPLPLNLIPWPARWKVHFLPPIDPDVAVPPQNHPLKHPEWVALAEKFRMSFQSAMDADRAHRNQP